ncbi:DUF456 domain-containing protein [Runella zeae]|jgi:uncharacterized protein YqgC (DUF456 family)|uniref:DUF456 domain-containing protein n=1 Tax=Runella zeae TaxID=94255 RepID=UPI000405B97E|nr:DUF456 domain-containing protein [Runella zeae]
MDILLLILGIAGLLVGLAGAVLPLPGPPLSFVGLLCLHFSKYAEFSQFTLYTLGIVTLIISVLDYYVPIWGVKKFGGTNYGAWGSTVGLLIGFFFVPAIGIFLGAFLGALIGELIGGMAADKALKAAFGSFLGFLGGITMKVILCLVMIGYAVAAFF